MRQVKENDMFNREDGNRADYTIFHDGTAVVYMGIDSGQMGLAKDDAKRRTGRDDVKEYGSVPLDGNVLPAALDDEYHNPFICGHDHRSRLI
jgi:hypothetical protein